MTRNSERKEDVIRRMTSTSNPRFGRFAGMDFYEVEDGNVGNEDPMTRDLLCAMVRIVTDEFDAWMGFDSVLDMAIRGSDEAAAWVCYATDRPGEDPMPSCEEDAAPGIGRFTLPAAFARTPEWLVLMSLLQSDDGGSSLSFNRNADGGYENDVFLIRPHRDYGDGTLRETMLSERPCLLFKPTGLAVTWKGEPFRGRVIGIRRVCSL